MSICELGYIVLGSPDQNRWRSFARDILGMMVSDAEHGLYLKMDERDFRFLVIPNAENRLLSCGWLVRSEQEFDALRERLRERIVPSSEIEAQARLRRVLNLFTFRDPAGNTHEVAWGPVSSFEPFHSPVGVSAFITGDLGLGHAVLPAPNLRETFTFWRDELGFEASDILTIDRGSHKLQLYFTHCGNQRQHSLALGSQPSSTGCIHIMVEVATLEDVGRALDRVESAGLQMVMTLGQHVNDECVSFYFKEPGGIAFEIGWAGMLKDWSKHIFFETTRASLWGHRFVLNDPKYQPGANQPA